MPQTYNTTIDMNGISWIDGNLPSQVCHSTVEVIGQIYILNSCKNYISN